MNARRFDALIQRWRTVASGLPDRCTVLSSRRIVKEENAPPSPGSGATSRTTF